VTNKTEFRLPSGLSHSAVSSYATCGEQFRLERVYRLKGPPSWALLGGKAVHSITEILDLNELGAGQPVPTFEEMLNRLIAEECERAKIKVDAIKPTGRASKEWPNKRDRDWWLHHGPGFVDAWVEWREEYDWELLTMPDGMPAIELDLETEVAGRKFRGYLDRAYVKPTGEIIVVDLKTGKSPGSYLQLGTYRLAMKLRYGLDVPLGAYWLAETGLLTEDIDLTVFTDEYMTNLYAMAGRGIDAQVFMPNTNAFCSSCAVRPFCRAKGGLLVNNVPITEFSEDSSS